MSVIDELKLAMKIKEAQMQARGGKILLWGPGGPNGIRKRRNLAKRLKRVGFEAYTSESLSKIIPSSLP